MRTTSNEDSLPISLKLGNFAIETSPDGKPKLLGKGTYGLTFLAKHCYLDNAAAIKVIGEKFLSQARARERFLQEAKAVAKLRHPHIAQVYDFGPADNGLFYAMEFCAGGDLSEWIKSHGVMSPPQLIAIAQQVASALKCCHGAKSIHRDLKPANIMLASSDGPLVAKLIDFGLVQNELSAHHEGLAAHYIGTPLYASPEQLREQEVDPRTDLFSLGMTLWHLATGHPPDHGISAEIISSRLGKESYEPRLPNSLPLQLRSIIARLVEKDRTLRFESASQLLDSLNHAASELNLPIFTDLQHVEGSTGRGTGKPEAYNAPPLPIENYVGLLGEDFHEPHLIAESVTGRTYRTWPKAPGALPNALHLLDPGIAANPDLMAKICAAAGKLTIIRPPGMLTVGAIRRYDDGVVIIMEAPPERDLVSELLERGKVTTADARAMLELIATTSDRLTQAELPGVELSGAHIFVSSLGRAQQSDLQPSLIPRFLFKRDCIGNENDTSEDAADTLDHTTSAEGTPDNAPGQFARLFYRIISGRKLAEVASKSIAGYTPVPELQEETNRTLAQIVASEVAYTSCTELLSRLLALEGLGIQAGSRTSVHTSTRTGTTNTAYFTATSTTGTRLNPAATAHATKPTAVAPERIAPIRPTPSNPTKKTPAFPVAAAILVVVILGGGYWWWSAPKPDAGKNDSSMVGNSTTSISESLPAGYSLTLIGDEMKSAKFTLKDTPLEATRNTDGWVLKLPATTLPAEIVGRATGYVPMTMHLKYRGDAEKPIHFAPEREKGTITVRRTTKHTDYEDFLPIMTRLLPEEEGHVPLAKQALRFAIESEQTTKVVPTGIYRIILERKNQLVIPRKLAEDLEVKAGSTATLALPPSWVGSYIATARESGSVAASGRNFECRFDIQPDFASSKFSDDTGEASLEDCGLDKNGDFKAKISWSKALEGRKFDRRLLAKREGESMLLIIEESGAANRDLETELGRKPFTPQEWTLSGTLRLHVK